MTDVVSSGIVHFLPLWTPRVRISVSCGSRQ